MSQNKAANRAAHRKSYITSLISFALGLSVSTGVVYVFMIGSTPVYIGYFVAALLFAALLFQNPRRMAHVISAIDSSVLVFVGAAALSLVPSLTYGMASGFGIDAPLTVIKGLVVLIAGLVIYVVAISLREFRGAMVCGVAVGIVANAAFSIVSQMAFESGSVFSLITSFPQDAFVVSLKWGVSEPAGSHAIYEFRAQGLFLEASHLMVFLVAWGAVCVAGVRHTFPKALVLACICYMVVQALSPNVAVLILEAVLILILGRARHEGGWIRPRMRSAPHLTILALLALVFVGMLVLMAYGGVIIDAVSGAFDSLADLNPMSSRDTGTLDRFNSMLSAISILPRYPFGAGWNTESLVLTSSSGGAVFASHSFALRLLIELGPLGLAVYCWLIVRHARGALQSSRRGRVVGAAIVCMAIAQFMNGITLLPYVWLALGLARGIELDRREASVETRILRDQRQRHRMKEGVADE